MGEKSMEGYLIVSGFNDDFFKCQGLHPLADAGVLSVDSVTVLVQLV